MLPSPCHVVSDLHIGAAPPVVERRFLDFLALVRRAGGSLVVNGDLFDFWFAWKTVIPRNSFRVLAGLAGLRDAGIPVLWLAGNHDPWGGDVLRQDVGVDFRDDWRGRMGGWEARVHHGDGLRAEDLRNRRTRAVLRHPWSVRAFSLLHPDWATRLATHSSEASRQRAQHDAGAGLRRVALAELAADPRLELVIFGHSHAAELTRAPDGGVYANPGTWLEEPRYLRLTEQRVELRRFDGSGEGECLDALDRTAKEPLPET